MEYSYTIQSGQAYNTEPVFPIRKQKININIMIKTN